MIFLDCLKHPIKDQINAFKIDDQEAKYLEVLFARAQRLLKSSEKPPVEKSQLVGQKRANNARTEMNFDQSRALANILKREDDWARAKNMINNRRPDPGPAPDRPERASHFDLTNFDLEVSQAVASKFQNRRNRKGADKRRPICAASEALTLNSAANARALLGSLAVEREEFRVPPQDGAQAGEPTRQNLKRGSLKKLNDYINPILAEQDPEEGVEEEYKKQHDQVFCWRFLRAVTAADQQVFPIKSFTGDVEALANELHGRAEKKPVPGHKQEEPQPSPAGRDANNPQSERAETEQRAPAASSPTRAAPVTPINT